MKNENKKKKIIVVALIFVTIIAVIMVFGTITNSWGFKKFYFYTQNTDKCDPISVYHGDNDTTTYYPNGKSSKKDKSNKKKECTSSGYHIYKNRVSINIGSMICGHTIELTDISVDKNMNVYIQAKEKESSIEAMCPCSPSINIYFYKKVNSVTLVNEDGTKLEECK
ncbi:MAG: hypothetical protein IIZ67_01150 [Bacilli bacterium]|nr:hypothetical protein [Bacilli bacterium]